MTQKLTLTKVCLELLVIVCLLLASEATGSEKFMPSLPPPAGKALVYVFRQRQMSVVHPLIFVNDYLLAEMHSSNYAAIYVPQGTMVIAATIPNPGYLDVPSPTGEWASLPGCSGLTWRRLAAARTRDIEVCRNELSPLYKECGVSYTETHVGGAGVHITTTTKHTPACNYKLKGFSPDAFVLLELALRVRPILEGASLTPASRKSHYGFEASELDTSLRMEVEAGKTYYIRYSLARVFGKFGNVARVFGKFETVDAGTGAKEIEGLHLAEFGGWAPELTNQAPATPQPPAPAKPTAQGEQAQTPTAASEIRKAAVEGDLAKVQTLLQDNPALVFSKDDTGMTPLHWAAARGHKDLVELLLANRAEVNAKGLGGSTPLCVAVLAGHKDVAELLLANKAEVDARGVFGSTPLNIAALKGHKEMVELLLAHGADVNARNKGGETPLHEAAYWGFKDMAELLLAHGADVNAHDEAGHTPLHNAELGRHDAVAELLRQHGGIELSAKQRPLAFTPSADPLPGSQTERPTLADEIQRAAKQGDLAKVQTLLKDDPSLVLSKDDKDDTPLHAAALSGHKDVAELLLANKAEVDAKGNLGWTPLYQAVFSGQKDVAELLLAHGADINAKDDNGYTPLYRAVLAGNNGVVEFLLAHGADVSVRDGNGYTPLHRAVLRGNKDIVELLLAHGADVNAKTDSGGTPLRLAKTRRYHEVAEVLRQHGGQIRAPREEATAKDGTQRFRVFFRDASRAKQAEAALVLAVSWTFVGTEGGVTQPSADVIDPATGSVLEHGFSSIIGPSGLAGTFSGPAALPFSTIYKKKDAPLRVYFKTGAGDLQLWWSREAQAVVVDQAKLIQLSPAWVAAAKELPPTPDHPAGGLCLSSHTPDGRPLVFFLEFTETQTLVPSPQIKGMGTE